MRKVTDLLVRFRDDERGVFAVIFGLMAIVLVAFAGAAVDYTHVETSRARAQVALDSAALGLQPTIFNTPAPTSAQLKASALALLNERLGDESVITNVDVATSSTGNGTLHLEATVQVNTAFVQLVGIPTLTARIVSEATRKRLNLEVAMVLDNSGSMGSYSRMTNLKKAARCAMNVLFNAVETCTDTNAENNKATTEPNIWIGLVPFTGFVNVGTGYKTASWMDQTGLSSISNDNFDNDDNDATAYNGTVNRWNLYTTMGVAWRGCVEARPYPYDTNDTTPSTATPDTLFVPEFAPDNPDSGDTRVVTDSANKSFTLNTPVAYTNTYKTDNPTSPTACYNKQAGTWVQTQTKTNCTTDYQSSDNTDAKKVTRFNNCTSSPAQTSVGKSATNWNGVTETAPNTMPATKLDKNGNPNSPTCYYSAFSSTKTQNSPARYSLVRELTCKYLMSDREAQERLCKYTSGYSGGSPNQDCPTNALTTLTSTKATVLAGINAMAAQGYTNIHQGTIWGYHMLTPTEPLTQAKAFEASTSKVMIVMTDGENTIDSYGFGAGKAATFQAYGFPINGRIFSTDYPAPNSDAQITAAMDSRTLESCNNAKAAGISIYTIGLSAPNQKTINLLTNCASSPSMAYFPTDPTTLTAIFKEIAEQLANLRLSQ